MTLVKEIVDRAVEDGVITNAEHEAFIELVHKDGIIDPEESEQISRIFRLIQAGKVKIVDELREASERRKNGERVNASSAKKAE